jgi:hypothetical protein
METELQKHRQLEKPLPTWERLYLEAWEKAFMEMMLLIAENYNLEFWIESRGQKIPSPLLDFWRESLKDLSPAQMREGLHGYMKSPRCSYRPQPGNIIENAAPVANDKPRKIKNPKCPDCSGSGMMLVECEYSPDSPSYAPGKKKRQMMDCYCKRIVYDGKEYIPEKRQLPPADAESKNLLDRLEAKVPGLDKLRGKTMPQPRRESQAKQMCNERELEEKKRQAFELAEKFKRQQA